MAFQIRKIQVWTAEIPDRPGAAAGKLELLSHAGIELEFVFTRPHPRKADQGLLYLAPISGSDEIHAAMEAGLAPALDMAMLAIEGDNRPGLGYDVMSRIAVAGINLRGLSVSAVGRHFVAYLAFDTADTAATAIQILATLVT